MSEKKDADDTGGGGKGFVIGLALATLIAVGAGGGAGFVLAPKFAADSAAGAAKDASGAAQEGAEQEAGKKAQDGGSARKVALGGEIVKLQPVTTNLRHPFQSWVRLEGALLVSDEVLDEKARQELAARARQDVLAYLRTLALKDLEGASNLAFLRDDLNERARVRFKGRVSEFIILSLVVE